MRSVPYLDRKKSVKVLDLRRITAILLTGIMVALEAFYFSACDRTGGFENGQAGLAFDVPWRHDFTLSAKLTLPAVPGNKRWYCIWIMVAEMKDETELPAMIQGGLMRWEKNNFKLQPFVDLEHSGKEDEPDEMLPFIPEMPPQEHELAISRKGSRVQILMDGRSIFEDAWHSYFRDDEKIYAKIAAEVSGHGDQIAGTVRHVELKTPGRTDAPYAPFQAAEDRGLRFACSDYEYIAVGRFDPKLPFRWVDFSCSGGLDKTR